MSFILWTAIAVVLGVGIWIFWPWIMEAVYGFALLSLFVVLACLECLHNLICRDKA